MMSSPQKARTGSNEVESWFTKEDTAEHFKTTKDTISYWLSVRKISGARFGKRVLIPLSEIQRIDAELTAKIEAV